MRVLRKLGLKEDVRVFLPADLDLLLNSLRNDEEEQEKIYREVRVHDRLFAEGIYKNKERKYLRIYSLDITDYRQSKIVLQETEARYQTIFNACPSPMTISTFPDGRYIDVNEAFLQCIRVSP